MAKSIIDEENYSNPSVFFVKYQILKQSDNNKKKKKLRCVGYVEG